jgi:hypothetical protein
MSWIQQGTLYAQLVEPTQHGSWKWGALPAQTQALRSPVEAGLYCSLLPR